MPLTFEEMADAGLKDLPPPGKPKVQFLTRILILVIVCALGYLTVYQRATAPKEKPIAAQILLAEVSDIEDVLPHVEDDSTEFKGALPFLKPIADAPKYRETEEGQKAAVVANVEGPESVLPEETAIGTSQATEVVHKERLDLENFKPIAEISIKEAAPSPTRDLPQDIVIQPFQISNDWGGIVLVPEDHILAKAYNSNVRLLRIEAHPIDGDYIRVWTRIENRTETLIETEVGCEFRGSNNRLESPSFAQVSLPPRGVIDAYFVSRNPEVHSYTVLVKR